jgi:hypothetical protein
MRWRAWVCSQIFSCYVCCACNQVFQSKRKAFSSADMRAEAIAVANGTEKPQPGLRGGRKNKRQKQSAEPKAAASNQKQSKWKAQSAALREAMRECRKMAQVRILVALTGASSCLLF